MLTELHTKLPYMVTAHDFDIMIALMCITVGLTSVQPTSALVKVVKQQICVKRFSQQPATNSSCAYGS